MPNQKIHFLHNAMMMINFPFVKIITTHTKKNLFGQIPNCLVTSATFQLMTAPSTRNTSNTLKEKKKQ